MLRPRPYGTFLVILMVLGLPTNGFAQEVSVDALRAHTTFLAHDLLEGRGTASRGEALAALYLTAQLRELGLEPLPGAAADFRIPVPLTAYDFDDSEAQLRIQSPDGDHTLRPPAFYHGGGGPSAFRDFGGDLLFAGATPGALAALEPYPDLTGYVVILGPPWHGIGTVEAELARRGAEGAIEVIPSEFYHRLREVRGPTRFALPAEVNAPDNQSRLPRVVVGPTGAEALGVDDKVRPGQTIDAALTVPPRVDVRLAVSSEHRTGYDVAALLPGTDPSQADNIVAFMAHYDHVGFGEPVHGDSIWNGFVDNATGTAILLELARVLAADPLPYPALFLFTTAEEQGLLGATWFVHRAPLPLKHIRAVINVDGGAPPADVKRWTVAAPDASPLAEIAERALRSGGWEVDIRPIISDSDHWAFHQAGVPALFLYPGTQAVPDHIHTPDDEWQADFPFEGLARYAGAALRIGRALKQTP